VVKNLYALWGLPLLMELQKVLADSKKEHDSYKQVRREGGRGIPPGRY